MYTNRQLGINEGKKTKSMERLSSGYRINRAADDAAGLSISEKMRGQIRGLKRASQNVEDGISLIQVADGALEQTHEILQRMRELAVQAANDINCEEDREAIQTEMDSLISEVDRIANQTEYNKGILPLLSNSMNVTTNSVGTSVTNNGSVAVADPSDINVTINGVTYTRDLKWIIPMTDKVFTRTITAEDVALGENVFDGITYSAGDEVITSMVLRTPNMGYFDIGDALDGYLNNYLTSVPANNYSVWLLKDIQVDDNGEVFFVSKHTGRKVYMYYSDDGNGHLTGGMGDNKNAPDIIRATINPDYDTMIKQVDNTNTNLTNDTKINNLKNCWIQAGANSQQGMFIDFVDATASGIGLTNVNVMSYLDAGNAIDTIDSAITKVSGYRSRFGAQQNRLEHAMAVDNNTSENMQYAESKIRDADMADEMTEFSKNSILVQAAEAMLTQANNSRQSILELLR
jgi:flagellin